MKTMVVTTMRDAAGAEVAREALADAEIPVEVRRLGGDVYLGSATASQFEVRVPEDRVADAHEVLETLQEDMEQAVLAAAGVPPGDEDERGSAPSVELEERPRKLSWAVALALVGPLPGVGVLYARSFALGWTMVGMSLAALAACFVLGRNDPFGIAIALKVADVFLAPIFAARFNRKLEEQHAARS